MDCPFVTFHIKVGIARHVELQNVVGALWIKHRYFQELM
jgi:hypothetical protein